MKMKSLALGLMLLFFAGMSSSAIASVVNYENGVTVTKVDDDKDKEGGGHKRPHHLREKLKP